jgi:hypothetical protein
MADTSIDQTTRIIVGATRLHDALFREPETLHGLPDSVRLAWGELQRALGITGLDRD